MATGCTAAWARHETSIAPNAHPRYGAWNLLKRLERVSAWFTAKHLPRMLSGGNADSSWLITDRYQVAKGQHQQVYQASFKCLQARRDFFRQAIHQVLLQIIS